MMLDAMVETNLSVSEDRTRRRREGSEAKRHAPEYRRMSEAQV
jgi:hypothetical protein